MFDPDNIVRKNIADLKPYSSARNEYDKGDAVFLDANESPYNEPFNRYPDPLQKNLRNKISEVFSVPAPNIFTGNGSDEAIDLLIRIFCEPGVDSVTSIDPSYGMYKVLADINNVQFRKASLNKDFLLDAEELLSVAKGSKIVFLCSPNNPTANILKKQEVLKVISGFEGLVVIDEAYVDFSGQKSWSLELSKYPKLVVLRTLSKAYGLAGIRLGMAMASEKIIEYLLKVKYPYNVNILSLEKALESLNDAKRTSDYVQKIIKDREALKTACEEFGFIEKVYPSDANFILVKVKNALKLYNYLLKRGVVIRNRSNVHLCEGCLRITVGTTEENELLIKLLKEYED